MDAALSRQQRIDLLNRELDKAIALLCAVKAHHNTVDITLVTNSLQAVYKALPDIRRQYLFLKNTTPS